MHSFIGFVLRSDANRGGGALAIARRRCYLPGMIRPMLITTFVIGMTMVHIRAADIVAHRGASHDAPENTLASFRLAWEQGADAIEGDFRLTRDGEIVCIHD